MPRLTSRLSLSFILGVDVVVVRKERKEKGRALRRL